MNNNKIKPVNFSTIKNTSVKTKPSAPVFFSVSLTKLYILSAITVGFYDLYWFYRNWLAIKNAEDRKISPFWRSIFSIFWVYPLFKEILNYSKQLDYQKSFSAVLLASLYIFIVITDRVIGRIPDEVLNSNVSNYMFFYIGIFCLVFLSPLLLLPVQKAINYQNTQIKGDSSHSKHTAGGIILIIIGIIFFLINVSGLVVSISNVTTPATGTTILSPEASTEKARYDSLTSQYTNCSTALETKLATLDKTNQNAIDQYNADLQACENIRLEQNASADKYNALIGQ